MRKNQTKVIMFNKFIKIFTYYCLVTLSVLLITSRAAYSHQEKIYFINVNFPPLWNNHGILKNNGIADLGEKYIKKSVLNYNYIPIHTTVARAQVLLSTTTPETYCAIPHGKGYFKNVIESKIWTAISGHAFISREEVINEIKKNKKVISRSNELELGLFFKEYKKLKGLITKKQRYPIIEKYFTKYKDKQVFEIVNSDMLALYKMVSSGRTDYSFQYESTVKYLQKLGNSIEFVTISELNNYNVDIVVGCNNTPLAKKFINDINNKIKELREVGIKQIHFYHSDLSSRNLEKYIRKLNPSSKIKK